MLVAIPGDRERWLRNMGTEYLQAMNEKPHPLTRMAYDALVRECDWHWKEMHYSGIAMVLTSDPNTGGLAELRAAMAKAPIRVPIWSGDGDMAPDHPLGEGLYNQAFRLVHDVLGHWLVGAEMDHLGEVDAWLYERRFYSQAARLALFTESIGQLGAHLITGKFPRQVATVLPSAVVYA